MTTTAARAGTRTASPPTRTHRPPRNRGNVLLGLAAWVVGIVFIVPVLWTLLTSFHSENAAATNPPSLGAPLTLAGYREFFGASTGASPWPPLLNSMTASVLSTVLVLALAIPAAYASRSARSRSGPTSCSSSCPPRCCRSWPACCRSTSSPSRSGCWTTSGC